MSGAKGRSGGTRKGGVCDPLINAEPGDNSKFLASALAVQELGKVRVDLTKPDEVKERVLQYFQLMGVQDKKPTYTGLALALGISRQTLWCVLNDKPTGGYARDFYGHTHSPATKETIEVLHQAVDIMTTLWEDYMQNGKINPASGIFLGKNFYGMRDEVEHVITPNVNPIDEMSAEDIAKRYIEDKK